MQTKVINIQLYSSAIEKNLESKIDSKLKTRIHPRQNNDHQTNKIPEILR